MPHDVKIPQLRWPATGILVAAAFGLIAGLDLMSMHAGFWSRDLSDAAQGTENPGDNVPSGISWSAGLFLTSVSLFQIYGAICMRRGRNYFIALLSALNSCIPFLSPFVFLSIPIGIWSLVVLRRPDVRAAFAEQPSTRY